jgi:hypothetical protein
MGCLEALVLHLMLNKKPPHLPTRPVLRIIRRWDGEDVVRRTRRTSHTPEGLLCILPISPCLLNGTIRVMREPLSRPYEMEVTAYTSVGSMVPQSLILIETINVLLAEHFSIQRVQ